MARYDERFRNGERRIRGKADRATNGICPICGDPYGAFHNGPKCADRWVKQCDEEARKLKEGTR